MGRARDPDRAGAARDASLRLLATTDLHMQILPYDYVEDREVAAQGLALVAAEARRAAAEVAACLWFDVGDVFEGGPLDDAIAAGGLPHPMPGALAAAGIAAGTLGNHDFDHGLDALERVLAGHAVPLTLCNIVRRLGAVPEDDTPFLPPFLLHRIELPCADGVRRPLVIGLVGAAPPQTLAWNAARLGGALQARDMVTATAAWAGAARAAGAEIIVALCHSGIEAAAPPEGAEHVAAAVAGLPEVDVVLAGHSHARFPGAEYRPHPTVAGRVVPERGLIDGTPVVLPGFWGQCLGQVDLRLRAGAQGGWHLRAARSELRPVTGGWAEADPEVAAATRGYHAAARAAMAEEIGRTRHALSTHFALVQDCSAVRLVHAAQFAAGRALLAEAGRPDTPLLSATAPLRTGGRQGPAHYAAIAPGPFRRRDLHALYGYANVLELVWITGADLRHWLERSASLFETVREGQRGALLHDPAHPGYQFDMISGATCRIDLRVAAAFDGAGARIGPFGRIVGLRVAGRAVAPEDRFALVTSSYRMAGGAGFPEVAAEARIAAPGIATRDAVARFIREGGAERELPGAAWGFVPLAGTTAVFRTGPGAGAFLPGAEGAAVPLRRRGPAPDGFEAWEVDLARADALRAG